MESSIAEFVGYSITLFFLGIVYGFMFMFMSHMRDEKKREAKRTAEAEADRQKAHTQAVKEHTAELSKANAHAKLNGISPATDSVTEWSR